MSEERIQRRLAAILAADVVGYSRLMGINEAGTLAALKAHRRELVDGKIAEHQGRIAKLTGDGMLVEFPSVVNAVACAVEIQRKMIERNADLPQGQRIEFVSPRYRPLRKDRPFRFLNLTPLPKSFNLHCLISPYFSPASRPFPCNRAVSAALESLTCAQIPTSPTH